MSMDNLKLSPKYKAFIRHNAPVEFLEGTTAAGKTTVGIFKFMLKVAESQKKYHIIAAKDIGTAEKNIINKDLGIVDIFGKLAEYNGNGSKDEKISHILFKTKGGQKVIYIMGYDDSTKWKKALGGQYGCLYIDEINTADIEFIREAAMRCDYFMATLNPDNPDLPVYKEYVNCSRPLPKYKDDAPAQINNMLNSLPKPGWTHWFFSFKDNLGLTKEKIAQIKLNVPRGTKLWKNKIEGLRGKATGLVFGLYDYNRHVISRERTYIRDTSNSSQTEWFDIFTAGLDTSYSQMSSDTIAMTFAGITNKGRYILLDEKVYSNASLDIPLAPSDTVINFIDFLNRNQKEWGLARQTFVDSADQATLTEFTKYKKAHPECIYIFNNAYKKITNIDRINLQLGWMSYDDERGKEPCYFICQNCTGYMEELGLYSWDEKKDNTPEDGHDHLIQSAQYGWIPYKDRIRRE